MSSQPVPNYSDPFNFNLPSPLPLPSISDTASVQNSAPTSSFSVSPTLTQPQPQETTLQSSNTLEEGILPPSISAALIPNIDISVQLPMPTSVSASLQYGANRLHQPTFYTSTFHLSSHMYSQQPPCASWATHHQNMFSPSYSPPNLTHIQQQHQQNFPTSPSPSASPLQAQNFGMHYRDPSACIYGRNVSMLHQARLQEQQQQYLAMMQYAANQHRMMMVQPLRSPVQHHYQQIVHPVAVPISPPHAIRMRVSQESPLAYSELFRTPPALPTPSREQVPWTGSNAMHFSGMTPERYLIPEERTIVGTHVPIHSSGVQTPRYSQCVRPQTGPIDVTSIARPSEQLASSTDEQACILKYPSLPVLHPGVTSARINTPTASPGRTATIIRPVPIRPLPTSSTFSWHPSAARPSPQTTVSHATPANVAISHLSPLYRKEASPTGQIRKGSGGKKKRRTAVKLPADIPSSSDGSAGDTKGLQGKAILISERDIDVGEEVVVETDKQERSHPEIDKKLEEYKSFVTDFKHHRLHLGCSLVDVTQQVQHYYGKRITVHAITNFEDLVLDKKSYIPLMATLKRWAKDTKEDTTKIATLQCHSIVPVRFREKRDWINAQVIRGLEEVFTKKANPTTNEMKKMAEEWKVGKDYIRNWFCNRRKRARKSRGAIRSAKVLNPDTSVVLPQGNGTKIPSLTCDITIEVSSHPRDEWSTSPYTTYI